MPQPILENHSDDQANRDPLSGTAGSHPVGTGIGAAAGGLATGALAGTVAGPAGTLLGGAVGAVVGGLAGKGVAEAIDPTIDDAYWRDNYSTRDYVGDGASFDDYGPAYRFGVESYGRADGRTFEEAEADLEREWDDYRGSSNLSWNYARHASRDSWQRANSASERDAAAHSDHDGN